MSNIDPLQLAQFMILPGASELVAAFSAIPPGPVRDSVVNHAQVLAVASGWTPPIPFVMDAGGRVAPKTEPRRLTSPYAEGLSAKSLDGQIVERLLRGEADHVVADDLGVGLGVIVRLKAKARREGRIVFPGDGDEKPKAWKTSVKKDAAKGKRKLNLAKLPVPDPPYWWEDPNSPVWDNPRLLPSYAESADGTLGALGPHDYRNYRTMELAAARHGLTMRQHMAQRAEIVRRIGAGERPTFVALDLRVSGYAVYSLLSKIGRGRMETLNALADFEGADEPEPEALPEDVPEPETPSATAPDPAPPVLDDEPPPDVPSPHAASALAAKKLAAARWGFESLEAYEAMRVRVRELRLRGWHSLQIEAATGQSKMFVKAAIQFWRKEQGVVFPPAPFKLKTTKAA